MLSEETKQDYDRLVNQSGYVRLEDWTAISMSGKDRKSFLHNFCTADVKSLEDNQTTEAFILNGKGKLLGHVHLLSLEDELIVFTVPEQFQPLHEHLDKYIIREDVQLENVSDTVHGLFVTGPTSQAQLLQVFNQTPNSGEIVLAEDNRLTLSHLELVGSGYLLLVSGGADSIESRLQEANILPCSPEAAEIVKIESGTPWFGVDSSDATLPQELRRDEIAISFNKGCYLGQETVARIDAIGHVNRFLTKVRFESKPSSDAELLIEEKKVGQLTSLCWSPSQNGWLALGYVKRNHCKPDTQVTTDDGTTGTVIG